MIDDESELLDELSDLRKCVETLLVAWLNQWDPGANQDVIDEAERLLGL